MIGAFFPPMLDALQVHREASPMDYDKVIAKVDLLMKDIKALRPLTCAELEQLRQDHRTGLTWASNAIEGNALSLAETKLVIEDGLTIPGKPLRDHLEAVGHAAAFDMLQDMARQSRIGEDAIKGLHHAFFRRIDEENAGQYRIERVVITGTEWTPPVPDKVPGLMRRLAAAIPEIEGRHPVVAAADLHAEFINVHPFIDGNGRVARLLMNLVLIRGGYPVVIIPPVRRMEYIAAADRGSRGAFGPMRTLVAEMALESCREHLRMFGEGAGRGGMRHDGASP